MDRASDVTRHVDVGFEQHESEAGDGDFRFSLAPTDDGQCDPEELVRDSKIL